MERTAGETAGAARTARAAAWTALALLAGTLVALARQPLVLDTVWAEDGEIFVQAALDDGLLGTLLAPYNGYAHLVPRLGAGIAVGLPLADTAWVISVMAALGTAACAVVVYAASGSQLASRPVRFVLAAAVLLVPAGQGEVLDNLANLHWYLLFASFWVLLWDPRGPLERTVAVVVPFAAAASDPLALLLAPAVLVRALARPGWRAQLPSFALASGLMLQALSPLAGDSSRDFAEYASPLKLAPWWIFHVGGRSLLGTRVLDETRAVTWALALAATVVVGLLLLALGRRSDGRRRRLAALALVTSAGFYVVPVFLTGVAAPRYEPLPVLLLYSALACVADGALEASPSGARQPARFLALALAVALAVVWVVDFRVPTPRADGPEWSTTLERARERCTERGGSPETIPVRIPPRGGGWVIQIACEDIGAAARPRVSTASGDATLRGQHRPEAGNRATHQGTHEEHEGAAAERGAPVARRPE